MGEKKWIDKIYSQDSTDASVEEFKNFALRTESFLKSNFSELEKSPIETKLLEKIQELLAQSLGELSGHELKQIDLNKVHIVDPNGATGWMGLEDSLGTYSFGHVYIPRNESVEKFTNVASHELSHASSFAALDPFVANDDVQLGKYLRSGYFSVKNKDNNYEVSFRGFNEAVTEFISMRIRTIMADDVSINEKLKDREILLGYYGYSPQVWILEKIFNGLMRKLSLDPVEINQTLVSDYVNGTYNFLRLVEKFKKGGAKALMNMTEDGEGWQETAEFFDLDISWAKKQKDDTQN
jgi:hypothetical protein